MDDPRIKWIKCLLYKCFSLKDDDIFSEFLKENSGLNLSQLEDFFDAFPEFTCRCVSFTTETVEDNVYDEVEISDDEVNEKEQLDESDIAQPISLPKDHADVHSETASTSHGSQSSDVHEDDNSKKKKMVLRTVERVTLVAHFDVQQPPNTKACVVFINRTTADLIPKFSTLAEAKISLPRLLEITVTTGDRLSSLHSVLQNVYARQLAYNQQEYLEIFTEGTDQRDSTITLSGKPQMNGEDTDVLNHVVRDEFLINLRKFMRFVSSTLEFVISEEKLPVPVLDLKDNPEENMKDEKLMAEIDTIVVQWNHQVRETIEKLQSRSPVGHGPLAEIDFWRDRAISLTALVEQFNQPVVRKILWLYAYKEHLSPASQNEQLHNMYLEAKENVNDVTETLSPLMQALQMIWIISRHYNKDERMVPLFERIAWSLCDRVSRVLEPSSFFCLSAANIINLSSEAKLLLDSWKSIYFVKRAEIEASGRDSRWEFDRKRLFAKTDYIAKICSDFENIARVISEFQKIFGPEAKSVMLEHKQIDGILLNVATLLRSFSKIEFNPFDPGCQSSWDACLEKFRQDVEKIKTDVKSCINDSFKSLRSSQGAFEMLQRFSSSQTAGDIASVFIEKFQDVLDQYERELRLVETTFDEVVSNAREHEFNLGPKYFPVVSGAISVERQLFNRIKAPMVGFVETKELTDTERGRQIRDRYVCVARHMKNFEEELFADWKLRISEYLPGLLERKLWKSSDNLPQKRPSKPSLTLARLRTGISSPTTDSTLTNTTRFGPLLPILDKTLYYFHFEVDFDDALELVIVETKYLDNLGLIAPDLARHLALNVRNTACFVYIKNQKCCTYILLPTKIKKTGMVISSVLTVISQSYPAASGAQLEARTHGSSEYC
ncbi:unnamed protein product [Dibothriocephalus latus]|uniref:Dynein heavy chain tail domain-containing protein n=1 Tax=Dibothriocephalus latus TaxID=60516 RepID=A0A3P7LH11_DIBLA|nr:unnamed protein product [Dibothriocephalus latus]